MMDDLDDGPPPLEDMSPYMQSALHELQENHNRRLYRQQDPGQQNQARSVPVEQGKDNAMFSGLKSGFFSSKSGKGTVKSKTAPVTTDQSSLVIPEVQDAMKNDKQEWLTDELLRNFATNPKLLQGMQNPKIMQAMDMMQKDPKTAREKFSNDKEVGDFISSFATLMSSHYKKLASQPGNSGSNV